jgi:hypothetical protein
MEDEDQNIHFKNLSVHRAATEEEALNLVCMCVMMCSIHAGTPLVFKCQSNSALHGIVCVWHRLSETCESGQQHQPMQSAHFLFHPSNG